MRLPLIVLSLLLSVLNSNAQIQSGPMLGYNTMKEVLIWLQTYDGQTVHMLYGPKSAKKLSQTTVETEKTSAFTAKLIAKNLEPGTEYLYKIYLNNDTSNMVASGSFTTQQLWQHRTDPPNFKLATGSCAYTNQTSYDRPGEPYGQGNEIFGSIAKKNVELMLWLGDNIYLREPDWSSMSGINHRYTHFKSMPEIQELWKNTHHYAIWDDHDFGPNDADRSFVGKELSLEAFRNFWGNYEYGINDNPGITSQFSFNDVDFFLLDNRYYRTPNERKTGERFILGEEQVQWLIDALVFSKASFKIVAIGGQFLNPAAEYENHATYENERKKILELIEKENIKNIIFLSGDRHKTELTKMKLNNGNSIYDFTCSPLSSKSYNTFEEKNNLRVEDTHIATQNFGILEFNGPFANRTLSIKTYDTQGSLLWEKTIHKE